MTTWQKGDQDPTEGARKWGGRTCFAVSTADDSFRTCTWSLGHTHPQHIAGGLRGVITEVWPVTA